MSARRSGASTRPGSKRASPPCVSSAGHSFPCSSSRPARPRAFWSPPHCASCWPVSRFASLSSDCLTRRHDQRVPHFGVSRQRPEASPDMVSAILATAGAAFAPVDQHYLFQARQMQALSLAVHIPLVCFGIAFPSLVLFAEWRSLRTGDPLFRTLARRWSKVMLALFAVGVVTGTILSLELGLLWPGFMAAFGNVFGLGFVLEGISFFVEAIFIAIYVYGWERLPPRLHFLSGFPVVVAGVAGSLFVISVNGWMNQPTGFTLAGGVATDVQPWSALFASRYFWHEFVHMYFAGYVVAGFLLASAYAWRFLRGSPDRYERRLSPSRSLPPPSPLPCRSSSGTGRRVRSRKPSRSSSLPWRGWRARPPARPYMCLAGSTVTRSCTGSRSLGSCRCSPSTMRARPCRGSTRCPPPSGRR